MSRNYSAKGSHVASRVSGFGSRSSGLTLRVHMSGGQQGKFPN